MGPEQFACRLLGATVCGCVSLRNTCDVISGSVLELTNSTQSNVAEDDDDENNTANHISAAPGGEKKKYDNKCLTWKHQGYKKTVRVIKHLVIEQIHVLMCTWGKLC